MTAEACRAVFNAAHVNERAGQLDKAFPQGGCEPWSLCASGGEGILDNEILARILTTPDDYNEAENTVIRSRLTALYSMGLSVVRQGASDVEIADTVSELIKNHAETRKLFGAVVISASEVRQFQSEDDRVRWFAVYATDAGSKVRHGDVFGTTTTRGQQSNRRGRLAAAMLPHVIKADTVEKLIEELRKSGI